MPVVTAIDRTLRQLHDGVNFALGFYPCVVLFCRSKLTIDLAERCHTFVCLKRLQGRVSPRWQCACLIPAGIGLVEAFSCCKLHGGERVR